MTAPAAAPSGPTSVPSLVATDLDGTLLRSDGTVSARTAAALAACAAAGLAVVFVTARPPRWLADLAPHVGPHGVALCLNGAAVVQVATGRVLDERGMSAPQVTELARRLRAGGSAVHLAVERAAGFAAERGYRLGHAVPPGSVLVDRIEEAVTSSTLKLLVRADDSGPDLDAFVGRVAAAVDGLAEVSHSGAAGLAEIAPPGVSKAGALARWSASRHVVPRDVWAAGDAPNDLPMLRWAGLACAVANAHPAVLAAADRVLPANDDDGVAVLLEEAARAVAGLGSSR